MPCYHPMTAYKACLEKTGGGKSVISFKPPSGPFTALKLPCGQCIGCRLDKSMQWAIRCVHEASLHYHNSFVTLTYDEYNLPANGSLNKPDYQRFLKRLRKAYPQEHIKYFLCGEYGSQLQRPHYHALLFNHDFLDKDRCGTGKAGDPIYDSAELTELWGHGRCWTGEVSFQSAAYVARYCMKKVNGELAHQRYVIDVNPDTGECVYREPEFIAMSRRPAIAKEWHEKFSIDTKKDYLTCEGKVYKIPKYYDTLMERKNVAHVNRMKEKRRKMAQENPNDDLRLRQMEKHAEQLLKSKERCI